MRLREAVSQLRAGGERLGKYELEKRHAIDAEHYDRAKQRQAEAQDYRQQLYKACAVDDLLEKKGVSGEWFVTRPEEGRTKKGS